MKNYNISDEDLIVEWANTCVDVEHLEEALEAFRKMAGLPVITESCKCTTKGCNCGDKKCDCGGKCKCPNCGPKAVKEAVELPTDGDVFSQFAEVSKMMQAAKRGMGLTNKIKDPAMRAKHKSQVMSNMNRIRAAVNRVGKGIAAQQKAWRDQLSSGAPAE